MMRTARLFCGSKAGLSGMEPRRAAKFAIVFIGKM